MNLLFDVAFGREMQLDPQAVVCAAGIERTSDIRDRHVRELRIAPNIALKRDRNVLADILHDSMRKRERLWLMPLTEAQIAVWEKWIPEGQLFRVGPLQKIGSEDVTPIGVSPLKLIEAMVDRGTAMDRNFLEKAVHNLDGLLFTTQVYRKLRDNNYSIILRNKVLRTITNPTFIAYAVVLTYSALRVLPVSFVPQFHGSLWILWAIDLTTAIPYTWGILTVVTAAHFLKRLFALAVTLLTFALPYVYFGTEGQQYPAYVIAIIVVLVVGTFALEGYKFWGDKRIAETLERVS
ncbi:MAG: hypothetical protein Q4A71_02230 [Actinomycetaceae bacterium]|nr:hypothetical protein [Actinomycetaceae bacterium]